jgi:hypothetical protein
MGLVSKKYPEYCGQSRVLAQSARQARGAVGHSSLVIRRWSFADDQGPTTDFKQQPQQQPAVTWKSGPSGPRNHPKNSWALAPASTPRDGVNDNL